ncbi:hypothetical protein Tco_1332851, partial [Tanacetum coccineum]
AASNDIMFDDLTVLDLKIAVLKSRKTLAENSKLASFR